MIDDILKDVDSRGRTTKLLILLIITVLAVVALFYVLVSYFGDGTKEPVTNNSTSTQSVIPAATVNRIVIMSKPSGEPVAKPSMTSAERIRLMSQPSGTKPK